MAKKLIGHRLLNALCEAVGVDPDDTYRVIVDAEVGSIVKVYVQALGTERLLELVPSLAEGANIRRYQLNENGEPVEELTA